jgi:hypothetical protein
MSGTSNCLQSRHRPVYSRLLLEARRVQYLCRPFVVTSRPYRYRASLSPCYSVSAESKNARNQHEDRRSVSLPTSYSAFSGKWLWSGKPPFSHIRWIEA